MPGTFSAPQSGQVKTPAGTLPPVASTGGVSGAGILVPHWSQKTAFSAAWFPQFGQIGISGLPFYARLHKVRVGGAFPQTRIC
jgi:hypothetical protein